jgi:uncharacterized protein YeaO (DUF488 family)
MTVIRIKRVYEPSAKEDGARFLVERLWPRGMKKDALHMDAWYKNLAPSGDLRRWFNHDPAKWKEFQRRYRAELADNSAAYQPLLDAAKQGHITLLYSAHDTEHNNAMALKSYLEERLRGKKSRRVDVADTAISQLTLQVWTIVEKVIWISSTSRVVSATF